MNTPQASPEEPTSEFHFGRAIPWGICLTLIAALAVLGAIGKIPLPWSPPTAADREAALKERVTKNNEFGDFADRTQAKLAWSGFQKRLDSIATAARDARTKRNSFVSELVAMESSEMGRKVASNDEAIALFEALKEQDIPSAEQLEQLNAAATEYIQLASRAIADQAVVIGPGEKLIADGKKLDQEVRDATTQLEQVERALSSLKERAQEYPAAEATLSQALARRAKQRSEALVAQMTKERERIREDAQRKQLENERLTEQAVQNAEIERQEAEQRLRAASARATAEREKQLVKEAEEKLAAERAHAAKLRRFEQALPEIRALLSPMISSGRMQLGSNGWTAGVEGPLSLQALRSAKALELTDRGMITLGSMFGGPLNRNDRPRGGFPETMTTNEITIRRAQELLVEFGDILVETGLLRP